MSTTDKSRSAYVIILTLVLVFLASGCSYIHAQLGETCNSRAHVQMILADYLSRRFASHSPVRLAIIPFSVPANLSGYNNELPGTGDQLAWKIHNEWLQNATVPIVEILNRQDWPRKKEEFFTGNFGAIAMAREAGYDLVQVGLVENLRSTDALTVHSKIIEVESGITVWYATSTVVTRRPELQSAAAMTGLLDRHPSRLYTPEMIDEAAVCLIKSATSEEIAE